MSDFAHRLPLDQIREGDRLDIVADEEERAAVADRLGLLSLDRFEAHAMLSRDGQTIRAIPLEPLRALLKKYGR